MPQASEADYYAAPVAVREELADVRKRRDAVANRVRQLDRVVSALTLLTTPPLYYISRADKRLWFGDYCEAHRQATLDRLRGDEPRYPLDF